MSENQSATNFLDQSNAKKKLANLYGDDEKILSRQVKRYRDSIEKFLTLFESHEYEIFSTPGRTEIGGNHTDHNHGRVLAASVNLDSIAIAEKTNTDTIRIYSAAYEAYFMVDLNDLAKRDAEKGSTNALIRGIVARFNEMNYRIGGFNAFVTSDVLVGSGLSSSASIEVLIAAILNNFYNNGQINPLILAQIGQYAENIYFGKPCGLMDQIACAAGGVVMVDFENPKEPVIKKVNFDFDKQNYKILVVDTGGSHANLTDEYASIPGEMKAVAKLLGKETAREISYHQLLKNITICRRKIGDRAVLRVLHFLFENERVLEQVNALEQNNFSKFLALINASGNSSNKWLQNSYSTKNPAQQQVNLALAVSENFINKINAGACRVHGGGFAGTIQVFLPDESVNDFVKLIEQIFTDQAVKILKIRAAGTVHINLH